MILAPFDSMNHSGTRWTGHRVVVGCYVDVRTVTFFNLYDIPRTTDKQDATYFESSKGDRFRVREESEYKALNRSFLACKDESKQSTTIPTDDMRTKYNARIIEIKRKFAVDVADGKVKDGKVKDGKVESEK